MRLPAARASALQVPANGSVTRARYVPVRPVRPAVTVRRVNPLRKVSIGAAPVNGFAPRWTVTVAGQGAPAVTARGVESVAASGI